MSDTLSNALSDAERYYQFWRGAEKEIDRLRGILHVKVNPRRIRVTLDHGNGFDLPVLSADWTGTALNVVVTDTSA